MSPGNDELFSGAPVAGYVPDPEALEFTYTYLLTLYTEEDDVALLKAHKQIGKGAVADEQTRAALSRASIRERVSAAYKALQSRTWEILADGSVRVQGSSGYYIAGFAGGECIRDGVTRTNAKTGKVGKVYCPSYNGGHQGHCYHLWMRELVRLAQVLCMHLPEVELREVVG